MAYIFEYQLIRASIRPTKVIYMRPMYSSTNMYLTRERKATLFAIKSEQRRCYLKYVEEVQRLDGVFVDAERRCSWCGKA